MAVDPVCKMQISEDTPIKTEYKEATYHFCSSNCQAQFKIDPKKFLR